MDKKIREELEAQGYDLVFEYKGSTIAVNTKEFTSEKEEAVYQKYGLKTLRCTEWVTLYNPEVWKVTDVYNLKLIKDCLAPEQPFFTVAPALELEGVKDLRHWDVASAVDLNCMFDSCESLEALILDGWDVSNVKDMSDMFFRCKSLESLSLNGWDVSGVKSMQWMFYDCESLKKLSLDGWCISEDTKTDWMFENCPAGISVESLKGRTTPCSVF